MAPRARPILEKLYGIGRATGRRAVYAESFSLEGFSWQPRAKLGEKWADAIGAVFDDFVARASQVLKDLGTTSVEITWDFVTKVSRELTGPFESYYTRFPSGYRSPDVARVSLLDKVQLVGDKDYYTDIMTGERAEAGSEPIREVPRTLALRAMSSENIGHGLPEGFASTANERDALRGIGTVKPRKPMRNPPAPPSAPKPATLGLPQSKPFVARTYRKPPVVAGKKPPVAGQRETVERAFAKNPNISNAEIYALFPNAPKPSLRREINRLRNAT